MTTRADRIETAARALRAVNLDPVTSFEEEAEAVLDAVLPQITTVEQLEALPDGTLLVTERGNDLRKQPGRPAAPGALIFGPLTVVWQPQPEQETAAWSTTEP